MRRSVRSASCLGAVLALAALLSPASPARAQDPSTADEVRQLRRLLQQQQQQMQALQRRLVALESRPAAPARVPAGSAGQQTVQAGLPGPGRPAPSGTAVAPAGTAVAPSGTAVAQGGAVAQRAAPATPQGAPGPENQPTPAGTIAASPQQQTQREPSPTVTTGTQPLPVLSGNDRVQVTVSGQVNRMVLTHADGSGKIDNYFADNNVSSTRLRALGSARLDDATVAVSALEFDLRSNSSASVTRQSVNNNGGDTPVLGPFRIRRAEVGVESERYGSVLLGRGSAFTDGIAQFDLSGTDVAFYSYLPDSGGSLQFASTTRPHRRSSDPSISQVYDDFDGPRDDRIRYDTPVWRGFTAGVSAGQGGFFDFGLRYAGQIAGAKIAGGVGYQNFTATEPRAVPPGAYNPDGSQAIVTPVTSRVAGSMAILFPNGFNFLMSGGWGQHSSGCCGNGLVATHAAANYFLKAGYQANLFPFGKTAFAIQGGQSFNRINDGDVASRVGLSIDQPVIAKGFEIYAGYEHLTLHRSGERFAPSELALIGSRVQF